jgi:hypothetical protein
MTLRSPRLDDRNFDQLVADALRLVQQKGVDWSDLSPGDPGIVLLELFAHLTEVMLYRLNRLPDKAYVEFLRLLGVALQPPSAAGVDLVFSRSRASTPAIPIPRGTRVSVERTAPGREPPVFITSEAGEIPEGEQSVTLRAYHCEQIEAELLGLGTSLPGQSFRVSRPPMVAPTGSPLDLIVAVEAEPEDTDDERIRAVSYNERTFRVWREAAHFSEVEEDSHVYVVDRSSGRITFAPAVSGLQPGSADAPELLAPVPEAGREIRVWYRRGGGADGNVAAGQLTVLKDQLPGVKVTNPARATGGKAAESLENALLRGPEELHSLRRAVTAQDFERLAVNASSRSVARARAFTRADLWAHARPGHVEVLLVPEVDPDQREEMDVGLLQAHQTVSALSQIQRALDERRPLGTVCVVNWARYKQVKVRTRVVIQREEDPAAVQARIENRLRQTITPLPTPFNPTGWGFGQALRASHVYDIALAEPGVRWVDPPRLLVEDVPEGHVSAIAIDHFQPNTWYVGSDSLLFRSLNDGAGWEAIGEFEGPIAVVKAHSQRAGLLAVAAGRAEDPGSEVRISADCGETWEVAGFKTSFSVRDLDWMVRDEAAVLLLATDAGLYEYVIRSGSSPVQILVHPPDQGLGFYAVAAHIDLQGVSTVAAAAERLQGVFLSTSGGRSNSFRNISQNQLANEDARVLAVQYDGPRAFLWAGTAVTGTGAGSGCYRWELRGSQDPPEGWVPFQAGWEAGSCRDLAFHRTMVYAASHRLGVLTLDASRANPAWQPPDINCGLPLRERERERLFQPVDAVAASPSTAEPVVMAGGIAGVYQSDNQGRTYQISSNREFVEKVTLPPTWLFISGEHEIKVVAENEAE